MTAENLTVNLRAAVYDFLCKYAAPLIDPNNIIWGNQNEITLPESDDYIIFSPLNTIRHGTGEEIYDPAKGQYSISETIEVPVQIDCYANTETGEDGMNAMLRAQAIETIARSKLGVAHFKKHGISVLYAENARNITLVDEDNRFHSRWSVTLNLSMRSVIQVNQDYFNAVNFELIEVDSRFKPNS